MKLCKDYAKEPFSFLVNGTTLTSDNPLKLGRTYLKMTVNVLVGKSKQFKTK